MTHLQIYLAFTHNFLLAYHRVVIVTRIIIISGTETHIFHSLHPAGIAVSALSVHRCSVDRDSVTSRKERDFQILSKRKAGYRKDESAKAFDEAYQLALRKKCALYDSVFVALASDLGLELKTFDVAQKGLSNGDTVDSSSD